MDKLVENPEITNAKWWSDLWENIEHWAFLGVVLTLAVEFAASHLLKTPRKIIEDERQLEIAKLTKEAETLRSANLALEARISPRRLSGEQRAKISALPSDTFPEVIVVSRITDPESQDFADDFVEALKDADWNVGPSSKDWLLSKKGIFLGFVDKKPQGFDTLAHTLDGANIKYTAMEIGGEDLHRIARSFQPGVLYLIVGAKP